MNTLVSLAAFVFSLALFISAHEQFRILGARASTSVPVDNAPADGDGLKYGSCLWMQAANLVIVLFTPVLRVASRVRARGEKKLESVESASKV